MKTSLNEQVLTLVRTYGREQLRKEISQVHQKLFTAAEHLSFRQKIQRLFSK